MEIMQAVEQVLKNFLKDHDTENLSNYKRYISMAQENYEAFIIYQQEYDKQTNNNATWDLAEHTNEDFFQYVYLLRRKEDCAIETILFEAFAVEAYINYYGEKKLGTERFYREYENNKDGRKRSTLYKYREIVGIKEESEIYKKLKTLLDARNDLAHNHVRKFDMNDTEDDDALFTLFNMGIRGDINLYQITEYTIGTTKELEDMINQMEGNQCKLG